MSAVAETVPSLVARKTETLLFLARREDLRLTYIARRPQRDATTGAQLEPTRGITFGFLNGSLRLKPNEDGEVLVADPVGGAGETLVPLETALKWLRNHRLNGDVNEGFWEVDPTAPPMSREEQDRIVAAATAWDAETLEEIVRQERAGWNREDLLHVAQGSIERIRALEAKAEEAVAAKDAEVDEERAQREAIQRQLDAALKEKAALEAKAKKASS
jgi:hypothetical protein